LFQIDSRLHQAGLSKAEANVRVLEARVKCSQIELEKARMLFAKGSITQADLDLAMEGRSVIEAELQAARADEDIARIKLSHTQVVAPISGKIGSAFVDVGDTVRAEETPLAKLVSVAPMFVEFKIDERTLLKLRRQAQAGGFKERSHPVKIGFGGEGGFRARGALVFSDNQVDPTTGTLLMRAEFPNNEGLFLPGMFARIRLQVSEPYSALLISEQCLRDDKTGKYVLVVNEKNVVERRDIKVGLLHDGARAVKEGLSPSDRVVLSGQDDLRPGTTVKPRPGPMSAKGPKVDP
jgi:RND family efflux transporter MFP subunit